MSNVSKPSASSLSELLRQRFLLDMKIRYERIVIVRSMMARSVRRPQKLSNTETGLYNRLESVLQKTPFELDIIDSLIDDLMQSFDLRL